MSGGVIDTPDWQPGQIWTEEKEITERGTQQVHSLHVVNTGDRPVQVGSHYHFFEVNRALSFNRAEAWGMRLAIAAGTARRFEPGMEYTVDLIAIGGERVVYGFNGLASGSLDDPLTREQAMRKWEELGNSI